LIASDVDYEVYTLHCAVILDGVGLPYIQIKRRTYGEMVALSRAVEIPAEKLAIFGRL
jgi:hypothetical protein